MQLTALRCSRLSPIIQSYIAHICDVSHNMDLRPEWPCKPAGNLAISEHCISHADSSFGGGIRHQNVDCDMPSVLKQQLHLI